MTEFLARGRYEVVRRLAAGGMGEVLLAEFNGDDDVSPGLLVVKRCLGGADGARATPASLRMLREEARLGLRLRHENIVETLRLEEQDGDPLLVMELLAGRSMGQVLAQAKKRRENVPIDVALAVLRGAACGLHFAHTLRGPDGAALGLVHRDVSPANIFVTFDHHVKLIDFGVAKSADSEIKTSTGILKGKLGYMSPEQSVGETTLTAQADVWALGVFFWEMLLAERLFHSPNPTATLMQIASRELTPPSHNRADVPRAVDDICMTMLARPLERRFRSCAAIVAAIDALPGSGGVRDVDVGAWLAGRFPEEADAGARDAARCARRLRSAPKPGGLVDGAVAVAGSEDEPGLVTRSMGAVESLTEPGAEPELTSEPDLATVRLDRRTVDDLRRASLDSAGEDDLGATVRVLPAAIDAARRLAESESTLRNPASVAGSSTQPSVPPGDVTTPGRPSSPIAGATARGTASPWMATADPVALQGGGPSSVPVRPAAAPLSPAFPAPRPPTLPPGVPMARVATEPARVPAANVATGAGRLPAAPRPAGNPPTLPPAVPPSFGPPMAAPSAGTAVADETSWLSLAVATFGGLVVVIGVVFAAVMQPPPSRYYVYTDGSGFDVVVAHREHVPPGLIAREIFPAANPPLLRAGASASAPVPSDELLRRLDAAGVTARARVPVTSAALLATAMPLLIVGLGALALAFAIPGLALRGAPGRRGALRAALIIGVVAVLAILVQVGGLGWPGRGVVAAEPRLEWR
jgi:serine/threonine-protein kinase